MKARRRRKKRTMKEKRRLHPEWLVAVRVGLLLFEGGRLLVGVHQMVALVHQCLLKLFLRLGF